MDKTITTALLIVVGMVMTVVLFNSAYPAVIKGGDAIANMTDRADEQMKSQIAVIHAAAELDSDGWWQDTNANGQFEIFVWVKNIGDTRITGLEHMDVFFGPEGNFVRVPYQTPGANYPYWTAEVENSDEWVPTGTLKITIHYGFALSSGRYFVKVFTPTGVSSEYFLGM